jgi:hypothetical protein
VSKSEPVRTGTLSIYKLTRKGSLKIGAIPQSCLIPECGRKVRYRVEILGYPVGGVCQACRLKFEKTWDGALTGRECASREAAQKGQSDHGTLMPGLPPSVGSRPASAPIRPRRSQTERARVVA